jgi:hypothetical protein
MNLFRGYTNGLASSYGIATYQSRTFARPSAPRPARRPSVKALKAVAHIFPGRAVHLPRRIFLLRFLLFSAYFRGLWPLKCPESVC